MFMISETQLPPKPMIPDFRYIELLKVNQQIKESFSGNIFEISTSQKSQMLEKRVPKNPWDPS